MNEPTRLRVRRRLYRRQPGYAVQGTHGHRQVSIFCRTEATARAIVADYKATGGSNVDRLLKAEPPTVTPPAETRA